jgi:Protein of unknown function (DUF3108)
LQNLLFMPCPRLLVVLLFCARLVLAQSAALPSKELLSYNIEWRLVTAGKVVIEWRPSPFAGQPGWQAEAQIESVGLVSKLYKVDINSASKLNQALCAGSSLTTGREGNRWRETAVTFDSESRKSIYHERDLARNAVIASQEAPMPPCVHDVLGGLFYLRTLELEPGQSIEIPVSDGKKSVMAKVEAQQREELKVPDGTYKTIRWELYLFNNVLFRRPARLYVWLSEDRRKLPVQIRVRMPITIGTITMQLARHE